MSEASPVTGEESERRGAARRARSTGADEHSVAVLFESGRLRHGGWAAAGLLVGAALVWKLGVVGKGVGVALIALGLLNLVRFVRSLRHPAGELRVSDAEVRLPRGLCAADPVVVSPEQVTAAFFLRRAVPWAKAGPILVIEADGRSFAFPRDWFASDADQRRVARALNKRLGRLP